MHTWRRQVLSSARGMKWEILITRRRWGERRSLWTWSYDFWEMLITWDVGVWGGVWITWEMLFETLGVIGDVDKTMRLPVNLALQLRRRPAYWMSRILRAADKKNDVKLRNNWPGASTAHLVNSPMLSFHSCWSLSTAIPHSPHKLWTISTTRAASRPWAIRWRTVSVPGTRQKKEIKFKKRSEKSFSSALSRRSIRIPLKSTKRCSTSKKICFLCSCYVLKCSSDTNFPKHLKFSVYPPICIKIPPSRKKVLLTSLRVEYLRSHRTQSEFDVSCIDRHFKIQDFSPHSELTGSIRSATLRAGLTSTVPRQSIRIRRRCVHLFR